MPESQACNFIKERLWHRCFPVNFAKFLRTPFLQNTSDSHLTCKVANKCLNVRQRVEVVERNKRWSPPFPCCPVSVKKTLIEEKKKLCATSSVILLDLRSLVVHVQLLGAAHFQKTTTTTKESP